MRGYLTLLSTLLLKHLVLLFIGHDLFCYICIITLPFVSNITYWCKIILHLVIEIYQRQPPLAMLVVPCAHDAPPTINREEVVVCRLLSSLLTYILQSEQVLVIYRCFLALLTLG